mgnify:CR=1 FL=1
MTQTIATKIMSPVAVVYEASTIAITAENSEGVFDILPDHARFMSLLNQTPITLELPDLSVKTFTFENAVLFFEDNTAVIYIQETLSKTIE